MLLFRPTLSAIRPNIQPPIGRIRKPKAKTPAVFKSCAVLSPEGKKEAEKYNAKAEYAYQSDHSTRFPMLPPMMAFNRFLEICSGSSLKFSLFAKIVIENDS